MAVNARIAAALETARQDASAYARALADGRKRIVRVAVGDPQAPFERLLWILDRHGLLGVSGRVRDDVLLVSMGDHFDWGRPDQRETAAQDAQLLLSWLAAHPPDQVVIILGNHDLGRLGEMAGFDDRAFASIQAEADQVYVDGRADRAREHDFLRRHPAVPSAECVARDFSTFRVEQRSLLQNLIVERRAHVAWAPATDFLICHAGVTSDELARLSSLAGRDAPSIASALDETFLRAFDRWDGKSAFDVPFLHHPGSADYGEARGMFFHRPSNPDYEDVALFEGPPRRRFDPRRLPLGLSQAIGHIRDDKCRRLLRHWHDGATPEDGPLRLLETDGRQVHYSRGTATTRGDPARVYFTDGCMLNADPARYELLDLDRRAVALPRDPG
jgi:hypothetical protein